MLNHKFNLYNHHELNSITTIVMQQKHFQHFFHSSEKYELNNIMGNNLRYISGLLIRTIFHAVVIPMKI